MRPYLREVFHGKPSWLTPIIHFRVLGIKPILSFLIRIPLLCKAFLAIDWKVSERVLENNWLYCFLDRLPEEARILDIGCAESMLSFELANMGYRVIGIDIRDYPLTHPNLSSIVGNICQMPFRDESFDFITCISTIEHIGLSSWGIPAFSQGDINAMKEILRCLKPNGLLYLTVPFGIQTITWQRIYNSQHLNDLLKDFEILISKYYQRHQYKFWLPTTAQELEKISSTIEERVNGVAIVLCRKKITS